MPVSGPDRCPECNYSLHGLPPPHRCPECGFEYDEHTLIWRPAQPRKLWLGIFATLTTILVINVSNILNVGRGLHNLAVVIVGVNVIMLAMVGAQAWRARSVNRLGRFVAVAPTGVHTRGHAVDRGLLATLFFPAAVKVPWSEVTGFAWERGVWRGYNVIVKRRPPLREVAITSIIENKSDAEHFVRAAEKQWHQYLARTDAAKDGARPSTPDRH